MRRVAQVEWPQAMMARDSPMRSLYKRKQTMADHSLAARGPGLDDCPIMSESSLGA